MLYMVWGIAIITAVRKGSNDSYELNMQWYVSCIPEASAFCTLTRHFVLLNMVNHKKYRMEYV